MAPAVVKALKRRESRPVFYAAIGLILGAGVFLTPLADCAHLLGSAHAVKRASYHVRPRLRLRHEIACIQLALTRKREAILHDFLLRARTETPQFSDRRSYRLDVGISVGPVAVTRDFVGSPIIHATIRSEANTDLSFVLEASIESDRGVRSTASAIVQLQAHQTQSIELICPETIVPRSLTWSTIPL